MTKNKIKKKSEAEALAEYREQLIKCDYLFAIRIIFTKDKSLNIYPIGADKKQQENADNLGKYIQEQLTRVFLPRKNDDKAKNKKEKETKGSNA